MVVAMKLIETEHESRLQCHWQHWTDFDLVLLITYEEASVFTSLLLNRRPLW